MGEDTETVSGSVWHYTGYLSDIKQRLRLVRDLDPSALLGCPLCPLEDTPCGTLPTTNWRRMGSYDVEDPDDCLSV